MHKALAIAAQLRAAEMWLLAQHLKAGHNGRFAALHQEWRTVTDAAATAARNARAQMNVSDADQAFA